ncbi:hypothetical protein [Acidithiobacillus thiooxidans]|uniref:hypothetical protein n=1 Tax=Acidithiobacillus thiooxidans TaxID=930 RepID=UPI001ED9C183|nr:hypothetical protein [Acidithiobacillus thiooxidans]
MRVAPTVTLTSEERSELSRIVASRLSSVRLSLRARMILLAAEGLQNKEIAERLGGGSPASRTLAQALSGTPLVGH